MFCSKFAKNNNLDSSMDWLRLKVKAKSSRSPHVHVSNTRERFRSKPLTSDFDEGHNISRRHQGILFWPNLAQSYIWTFAGQRSVWGVSSVWINQLLSPVTNTLLCYKLSHWQNSDVFTNSPQTTTNKRSCCWCKDPSQPSWFCYCSCSGLSNQKLCQESCDSLHVLYLTLFWFSVSCIVVHMCLF